MSLIAYQDIPWLEQTWNCVEQKLPYTLKMSQSIDFIPYTAKGTQFLPGPEGLYWWTNGFWPALLWQMHIATGEDSYKNAAQQAQSTLSHAFSHSSHLHHDVGFLYLLSAGINYRLTHDENSRELVMRAADFLAGRFNPKGYIRAWNGEDRAGWAIIDTMMNLPLLYFASFLSKDPRYMHIAKAHAETTLEYFIRPDGSVHHIVVFDPRDGEALDAPFGQGYEVGSSWSRGQAWALYGFTLCYLNTGEAKYLQAAKRVAHYFIACTNQDWLPDCDFRAPKEPVVKDNCAGNIAASGLIEIAKIVPELEKPLYLNAATNLLKAVAKSADFTESSVFMMQMCTADYHGQDRHIPMVYGDYFFVEALQKLRNPQMISFF